MTTTGLTISLALGLVGIGLFGLLTSRHLVKIVVALQIMTKGTLVALLLAASTTNQLALGQSLVLTVIVVDTATAVIGLALIILVKRLFGTLDLSELSTLKG
jgi:NADH:ubiquinone oxidoreductase subunit K